MRFLAADQRQAGTEPRIAYVLGICEQGGVEHKFRTMVKDKAAGKRPKPKPRQDWDEKFRRAAPCLNLCSYPMIWAAHSMSPNGRGEAHVLSGL